VSCNQLSALPDGLGRLSGLARLGLSWNQLSALPAAAVGTLTNLTQLSMQGNLCTTSCAASLH